MSERSVRIRWYEVVYLALLVAFVGLSIYFIGRPKVGLVDIRKISEEIGVTKQRTEEYNIWRAEALERIKAVNLSVDEKVAATEAKLKKTRRKADKEELEVELVRLRKSRAKSIEMIRKDLSDRWRAASVAYREQLDPIIKKVARKKRLDIVLEAGKTGVAYATKRAVITDDVIAEARAISPGGSFVDGAALADEDESDTTEEK